MSFKGIGKAAVRVRICIELLFCETGVADCLTVKAPQTFKQRFNIVCEPSRYSRNHGVDDVDDVDDVQLELMTSS